MCLWRSEDAAGANWWSRRTSAALPARTRADPALVKALARAHRRKRLLESGRYGSLAELAAAEKIDRSYLGKTLRLTLLAPDIVEAILDGRQSCALALPVLLKSVPSLWDEQRSSIEETNGCASRAVATTTFG